MRIRLAVLGGLVFGIGVGIVNVGTTHHGWDVDRRGLYYFERQATEISSILHSYKQSHGHYPTNDEGLWAVADTVKMKLGSKKVIYLARCRVTQSGVLSWWGEPIIYENRQGWLSETVKWSGVSSDRKHEYSFLALGAKLRHMAEDLYIIWLIQ